MVDIGDPSGEEDVAVLSRRQMMSRATYGLGAMMLPSVRLDAKGAVPPAGDRAHRRGGAVRARRAGRRSPPPFSSMRLGDDGQPRSVCRGRHGVVVVGVDDAGDPISWTNSGDVHWHRHALDRPSDGQAEAWGVAEHRDEFVAVGSLLHPVSGAPEAADPAPPSGRRCPLVWRTGDGARWDCTMLDDVDDGHAQLMAVSCHSRLLVAMGSTLDRDGVQGNTALALASDNDGRTWHRCEIARADRRLAEGSFTGVARVDGRWIATSTDVAGGAVWASPDGLRWSTVPGSAGRFRNVVLHGLAAREGHVYLAGSSLIDHTPRLLVSTDSCRSWRPLRGGPVVLAEPDATITDVTLMSGQVVLVGTSHGQPVIEGGSPDAAD